MSKKWGAYLVISYLTILALILSVAFLLPRKYTNEGTLDIQISIPGTFLFSKLIKLVCMFGFKVINIDTFIFLIEYEAKFH